MEIHKLFFILSVLGDADSPGKSGVVLEKRFKKKEIAAECMGVMVHEKTATPAQMD